MKIDANSGGTVDWDEFTSHILLEQVCFFASPQPQMHCTGSTDANCVHSNLVVSSHSLTLAWSYGYGPTATTTKRQGPNP
eukprot:1887575-Pyramimonas_sp.AAC.1